MPVCEAIRCDAGDCISAGIYYLDYCCVVLKSVSGERGFQASISYEHHGKVKIWTCKQTVKLRICGQEYLLERSSSRSVDKLLRIIQRIAIPPKKNHDRVIVAANRSVWVFILPMHGPFVTIGS